MFDTLSAGNTSFTLEDGSFNVALAGLDVGVSLSEQHDAYEAVGVNSGYHICKQVFENIAVSLGYKLEKTHARRYLTERKWKSTWCKHRMRRDRLCRYRNNPRLLSRQRYFNV